MFSAMTYSGLKETLIKTFDAAGSSPAARKVPSVWPIVKVSLLKSEYGALEKSNVRQHEANRQYGHSIMMKFKKSQSSQQYSVWSSSEVDFSLPLVLLGVYFSGGYIRCIASWILFKRILFGGVNHFLVGVAGGGKGGRGLRLIIKYLRAVCATFQCEWIRQISLN